MEEIEKIEEVDERYILKNSRRNFERKDSVSPRIIAERKMHIERLGKVLDSLDRRAWMEEEQSQWDREKVLTPELIKLVDQKPEGFSKNLERLGFGKGKRRIQGHYVVKTKYGARKSVTGAEGAGVHVASAHREWPLFKHLLPEIAFAGHR